MGSGAGAQWVGPTLIEHVTYRADAHSTSDDPSRYRPKDDWAAWPLGEPIERLKQYLISQKEWSAQHHATQEEELKALVVASWQEAITYGSLSDGPKPDPATMFEDVYKEIPAHLARQREQWRKERG